MTRRAVTTVLMTAIAIVAVGGCGDPATAPGAAPATEAPADADTPATEPLAAPAPTWADGTIVPAEGPSDDMVTDPVDSTTATTIDAPLGGVTVDDPLPPQVDASVDPAVAEVAVRFAYQHWILVDLDPTLRARLVEDGETTTVGLERGMTEARGIIDFGRIAVDEVQFTGVDSADVVFRVQWQDGPSPYFPDPMRGTAVYRDGSWRISRHSLCLLAFGVGQGCAGPSADLPVAPAAYLLRSVPADLQWIGDPGSADIVAVPGMSMWSSDPTQLTEPVPSPDLRTLSLTTDVLVGSSALTDVDADLVLATGRYGIVDGAPVAVAGGRARAVARDGFVQLVQLRDDDVVVSAYAQGLTIDELIAIVDGLVPTELPPGFTPYVELG